MPSEPKSAATGESPDLAQLQLPQSLPECHAIIAELRVRVKWLEERVKLDSNNSSKPPSSDGPGKPNRSQRRRASGPDPSPGTNSPQDCLCLAQPERA